jgi:TonB family protein
MTSPALAQEQRARLRLALALTASAALHLGLAQQLSFLPGGSSQRTATPATTLHARIVARYDGTDIAGVAETGPAEKKPAADPLPPGPRELQVPGKGEGLAIGDALRYFPGSELDRRPISMAPIEPEYPGNAGPDGGYLLLRLFIGESGKVDRVVMLASEPEGVFDQAAMSAFGNARFYPGIRQGTPVKSEMLIELKYYPKNEPQAVHP